MTNWLIFLDELFANSSRTNCSKSQANNSRTQVRIITRTITEQFANHRIGNRNYRTQNPEFLHQDLHSEGKSLITLPPYSLDSSSSSRIKAWRDAGGAWCFRLSQRVKVELSMTVLNPLGVAGQLCFARKSNGPCCWWWPHMHSKVASLNSWRPATNETHVRLSSKHKHNWGFRATPNPIVLPTWTLNWKLVVIDHNYILYVKSFKEALNYNPSNSTVHHDITHVAMCVQQHAREPGS